MNLLLFTFALLCGACAFLFGMIAGRAYERGNDWFGNDAVFIGLIFAALAAGIGYSSGVAN
jgi:hypothetical protein